MSTRHVSVRFPLGRCSTDVSVYTGPSCLAGCRAAFPLEPPKVLSRVCTPLRWDSRRTALASHPDHAFVDVLLEGIRVGFDYRNYTCRRARGNMSSVWEDESMISSYLDEERHLGRVVGPLDPGSFPGIHVSPIGLVPKGLSGKWRLIVDLSSLQGYSVNDGILFVRIRHGGRSG